MHTHTRAAAIREVLRAVFLTKNLHETPATGLVHAPFLDFWLTQRTEHAISHHHLQSWERGTESDQPRHGFYFFTFQIEDYSDVVIRRGKTKQNKKLTQTTQNKENHKKNKTTEIPELNKHTLNHTVHTKSLWAHSSRTVPNMLQAAQDHFHALQKDCEIFTDIHKHLQAAENWGNSKELFRRLLEGVLSSPHPPFLYRRTTCHHPPGDS